MYNKSVLPKLYTDALNAVKAALLKALIAGNSMKNIIVTRNLLKGIMIWKSGFSF